MAPLMVLIYAAPFSPTWGSLGVSTGASGAMPLPYFQILHTALMNSSSLTSSPQVKLSSTCLGRRSSSSSSSPRYMAATREK